MPGLSLDSPENILAMQRIIGNQRVQRLLATSGDMTGKLRRDGTGTAGKGSPKADTSDKDKDKKPAPSAWETATLRGNPDLLPDDSAMKWILKNPATVALVPDPLVRSSITYPQNTIVTGKTGSGTEPYGLIGAGKPYWRMALPDAMPTDLSASYTYMTDRKLVPGSRQTLKDGTAVYTFKLADGTDCLTAAENVTDHTLNYHIMTFPGGLIYKVPQADVEQKSGGFTRVATPLWDEKGPKPEDVKQTNLGDCYFQAALIELAQNNPEHVKRYMMYDHEGTVTVRYWYKDGKSYKPEYIKVDKSVPTDAGGNALYNDGALWVKMAQKAFAVFAAMHGKYGELLKPPGSKGYQPLENGNSYRCYSMIYGNAVIKADQESINYDEDDPTDLGDNNLLIELLLQKSDPDKYLLPGQAMNLNVRASADAHMKRLQDVLPLVIESLKKGGASFDRQRTSLLSLRGTVKRAIEDYKNKKEGETPESLNDLSKAAQRLIDGDFGKKTVPNNKHIASIQTVLELLYDVKNIGTDNSPGTRFVYSHHLYAIMGAEFKDDKGKKLLWDNDLKKARKQIVRWADANLSTVTIRNPHRANSPTANIAPTPGPDDGKFTLSLAQFIRNFSHIDFAKVKKSG
jgi:hypothetical protein